MEDRTNTQGLGTARRFLPQRRMEMLDRLVDSRISLVLGPLDVPPIDRLRVSLVRLAAAGPHTRVGQVLGSGESWIPLGAGIAEHTDEIFRTPPDSVTDLRRWIEDTWVPGLPLQFAVTPDRIGFVADHRLMDATLAVALIPTLFQLAAGGPVPSSLRPDVRHPLASALRHTFLKRPGALIELARHLRDHRAQSALEAAAAQPVPADDQPGAAGEPVALVADPVEPRGGPEQPRVMHLVHRLPLGVIEQVRRWDAGRAGVSAGLLLLTTQALREAGLPVAPHAILVVNLRRYLPSHSSTLGNFITGIKVPVSGPAADPAALGQQIEHALDVGRPLLGTAITVTKGRLLDFVERRGEAAPAPPASPPRPARVSFSFSGRWRAMEALPWQVGPEERYVEPLGDAGDPDGIGFLACSVDRRLRLGASFRADRFDPEVVDAAMAAVGSRTCELLAALDAQR